MKKISFFFAFATLLTLSVGAQQLSMRDSSVLKAHIMELYPYHGPQYVLDNSEKTVVRRKDKTRYLALSGGRWIKTTIRIGEEYWKFKDQYFFNASQRILIKEQGRKTRVR